MARPPRLRGAPCSDVHLQRAAAHGPGPARRAVSRGGLARHVPAPAAPHVCHPAAAQQVLAVPAQELGHRAVLGAGFPGARRGDLAAGAALSAWRPGRSDVTQPVLGAHHGPAARVRCWRWVPRDVERVRVVGIHGLEGLRQLVRRVGSHDVVCRPTSRLVRLSLSAESANHSAVFFSHNKSANNTLLP